MRGFTFLLLLATTLLSGLGCTSDNILTYEVPVETYPQLWVDSFIQPDETDGYDILWVIDRSGSMNNHDTQLLLGLEEMLTSLPITTSWRLGIISADPDDPESYTGKVTMTEQTELTSRQRQFQYQIWLMLIIV